MVRSRPGLSEKLGAAGVRITSTYNSFALGGSIIAFYSGYDENFFDGIAAYVTERFYQKRPS